MSLNMQPNIQTADFFIFLKNSEKPAEYNKINTEYRFDQLYNSEIGKYSDNFENTIDIKNEFEDKYSFPGDNNKDIIQKESSSEVPDNQSEKKLIQYSKPETEKIRKSAEKNDKKPHKEDKTKKINIVPKTTKETEIPLKSIKNKETGLIKEKHRIVDETEKENQETAKSTVEQFENDGINDNIKFAVPDEDKQNIRLKHKVNSGKTDNNPKLSELKNIISNDNEKSPVKVVVIDTRTLKVKPDTKETHIEKNKSSFQDINLVKSESNTKSGNNEIEIIQKVSINNINKESQPGLQKNIKTANNSSLQRFSEIIKSEVVKNTGLILRDNGKGEIKLVLKPESLGNIRIKVLLDNNNIEGKIIVENNNIKQMFQSNMNELEQAFKSEGFESASLEVSVSGQGSQNREQAEQEVYPVELAENYEKNTSVISEYIETYINMVV